MTQLKLVHESILTHLDISTILVDDDSSENCHKIFLSEENREKVKNHFPPPGMCHNDRNDFYCLKPISWDYPK